MQEENQEKPIMKVKGGMTITSIAYCRDSREKETARSLD